MLPERRILQDIQTHADELARAVAEAESWAQRRQREIDDALRQGRDAIRAARDTALAQVLEAHEQALKGVEGELERVRQGAGLWAAPWDDARWKAFAPSPQPPAVVRIGALGITGHFSTLRTPALIPFTGGRDLVVKASGAAKSQAIQALQAVTLRILALVPPAKLRMLLIDPQGLGQNVAVFMNLKEYMDELVGGKAWVERQDIEKRLADLSAHMEMVIQTYLRGHYKTMEEYNAEAGEVAEPYRLVVVMNFPVNFTDEAANRLVSVATNGPRCGVYTLVMVDTQAPLPHGFNLADLERPSNVVAHDGGAFVWQDPDYQRASLELDNPPPQAQFEGLIHAVGAAAKDASKVELPFEKIALDEASWWQAEAASGLRVPVGRAGARKLQYFEVGKGMEQHALVAGRTGSGKSTLLHVLTVGLAMAYPPEELELYLVDFKKGVEFKDYATFQLPHARVVAIESEREFGLSVLRGLDAEMVRRGEAFREAGVSNLPEYRALPQSSEVRGKYGRLPRILLLVDEFQEFFTADDTLSHDAALLLDRLARQGRSFGMHVLLGSQTLAGAYTLARSTMNQMAVRIALQCSDADSRLILGEDNPAAQLLSRPGDAFYNPQGGLKEGNVRFQIAWLEDKQKEACLERIAALGRSGGRKLRRPIVFEGNAPATLEEREDHPLKTLLEQPDWPGALKSVPAWLGEPVAIKQPTAAVFARRRGRNLLVVGRDEEAALGMLGAAVISLAAQHRPDEAGFYLADLTITGSEDATFVESLREALPHPIRPVPPRRLADAVDELARIVQRRVKEDHPRGPALYLVLAGVQRARDLRREDDFSLRKEAGPPGPAQQFASILRDGPEVGVHVLAWSDAVAPLNLVLDRRSQGEFGIRVALAMTDKESNELLDTPAAARLGPYRALLFDDERVGTLEKFRPYERPVQGWLARAGARLKGRVFAGPGRTGEEAGGGGG